MNGLNEFCDWLIKTPLTINYIKYVPLLFAKAENLANFRTNSLCSLI